MITNKTFNGEAEIIVYDKQEDGSLKESFRHKQHNKILIRVIEKLLARQRVFKDQVTQYVAFPVYRTVDNYGPNIGIFSNQEVETFSRKTAEVIAIGDSSLISDSYIKTPESNTEPANVIYKQRFLSPSQDITFYSLGIIDNTYKNQPTPATISNLLTYILLNTPITQTTNQVLDINYKVFIDWEGSTTDVNYNGQKDIEKLFLGDPADETEGNYRIGLEKNQPIWGNIVEDPGTHLYNYEFGWNIPERTQYFGFLSQLEDTFNLTNRYGGNYKPGFEGSFVRGWQYGGFRKHDPLLPSYLGRDYINKTSNLSSVYSHSVGATRPMYDANKLANSSWQPLISDDNTTKEYPAVYALKVSKAGGLGVGEYKVYKTGWAGWSGNQYEQPIGTPFVQFDMSLYYVNKNKDNYNVESNFDCYNHRWNYTWSYAGNEHYFVSYVRDVGVALFKLTSETFELVKRYKLSNNPSMQFFIHDIEVLPDQNLIYVAAEGGLFKIDTSSDTITQEHTERCMCVVTGYQDKVFAVFTNEVDDGAGNITIEGKISSDDDYTTALPDGATLDPSEFPNWENVWRLYIDKESTDYNMMLITGRQPRYIIFDVPQRTQEVYYIYWRNNTEYVKREIVYTEDAYSRIRRCSDLICFPENNSVVCDNGLWIYATHKYWDEQIQVRYLFYQNLGEDFKQDFTNTGWRADEANYYSWSSVGVTSTDTNLYFFPSGNNQRFTVFQGSRLSIGRFAEDPITNLYSHMTGVSDVFKKYEGEGSQYKLQLLLGSNNCMPTSPHFHPNAGGGTTQGWLEGQDVTPAINYWDGYPSGTTNRMTVFADLDIDLDTDTININIKGAGETTPKYSLRSYAHPDFGSLRRTSDKQIICFPVVGTTCSRGFYMISLFRDPDKDLESTYIQAYSWNGTSWIEDDTNTGPGKPLHTATEPLVNGLSVGWQELSPTDSQDLVLNQYYTFTRTTAPNMIPVEAHTPNFDYYHWWSFRRRKEKSISVVVPSNQIIFVPEAPDGTNTDIEWHGLANTNLLVKVSLDGEKIGLTENSNTNPPAGTTYYVRSTGRFYFNAADVGKTANIEYVYYLKYDDTEE